MRRCIRALRRTLLSRFALALLIASAIGTASANAQAPADDSYKVVVNAANPVSSLSRNELSRLFLKKVTSWKDSKPVALVDQRTSSSVRESFTKDVHGRQVSSVTSYWQQMIFAGRAIPPVEKASDLDVATFVAANPSAIGYVSASAELPPGVKAITVLK